jgi:hypothetical protein
MSNEGPACPSFSIHLGLPYILNFDDHKLYLVTNIIVIIYSADFDMKIYVHGIKGIRGPKPTQLI